MLRTNSSTQNTPGRSVSTHDLLPTEATIVKAMQQLGFGRFEFLRIDKGELVLDPWPTTVRGVKFAVDDAPGCRTAPEKLELKRQVIELLDYVRAVDAGEIRCLEVRHGLPFSMEVELAGSRAAQGGHRG